jgi:uncharacterized membrane protein
LIEEGLNETLGAERRREPVDLTLYEFLKFLHVLMAVVAVGFNATYGIWLSRLPKAPEHAAFVLGGVKILDDRYANPAYGLLMLLGSAMVFGGDLSFTTFWIGASIVLYVALVVLAITLYSPVLRRQVALAEAGRVESDEYRQLTRRGGIVGGILMVIVVVIIFFMVTKPTF